MTLLNAFNEMAQILFQWAIQSQIQTRSVRRHELPQILTHVVFVQFVMTTTNLNRLNAC